MQNQLGRDALAATLAGNIALQLIMQGGYYNHDHDVWYVPILGQLVDNRLTDMVVAANSRVDGELRTALMESNIPVAKLLAERARHIDEEARTGKSPQPPPPPSTPRSWRVGAFELALAPRWVVFEEFEHPINGWYGNHLPKKWEDMIQVRVRDRLLVEFILFEHVHIHRKTTTEFEIMPKFIKGLFVFLCILVLKMFMPMSHVMMVAGFVRMCDMLRTLG